MRRVRSRQNSALSNLLGFFDSVRALFGVNFAGLSRFKASSFALVVANLLPLFGVLFLGWDAFSIVALYWVENIVIGGIHVLKMLVCRRQRSLLLIPFFALHYGFFCFIHGALILAIFDSQKFIGSPADEVREFARLFTEQHLWWAIAALAVSHLYSFAVNYIGQREYLQSSSKELMTAPYGRVMVLHVAILFGGWIAMGMGSNFGILFLLIVGKTLFDLSLHLREHEKMESRTFETESPAK
jgi:hypothetical protein